MAELPPTAAERRANVETVQGVQRRLVRVRDQLATAAAMIGPLYREVVDMEETLSRVLARLNVPADGAAPTGRADKEREAAEFTGEETR